MKNFPLKIVGMVLIMSAVTSCGFTPIYATGSQTGLSLSNITVAAPQNSPAEYILVKELEERFGRNLNGSMVLEYGIALYEEGIESVAGRIQLVARADYRIVSSTDSSFVFGGTVENFVAYNTDGILLTSASQNSLERLMSILADQMFAEIAAQLYVPATQ